MSSEKILEERPITMAELKEDLVSIGKKEELNFRANKTKSYLNQFIKTDRKQAEELSKNIQQLNIPRLKERQIVKLTDYLPKTENEIKMLFVGETTTITDENIKKILEVIKEYVKKK